MADLKKLKATAAALPDKSGIYFFKNASGGVVYIGKARSLRDRVRSYFVPNPDEKVLNILRETAAVDFILTDSEKEAALLENNFIQEHRPRFNLRLKDDKSYPYLRISENERFARNVEYVSVGLLSKLYIPPPESLASLLSKVQCVSVGLLR